MLSQADGELVRRDPQLPGLGMLLDPDAFADTVRRLWPETSIDSVRPQYVRYKPATSCLVGYIVSVNGIETDVYARCHRLDLQVKVAKAMQRHSVAGALGAGIMVLPESATVVYVFPNDHEIRALRRLFDPQRRSQRLKRILPDHAELWCGSLKRIRYNPERRYVARLSAGGEPGAVVKFYADSGFEMVRHKANVLVDQSPLRVPRVIGAATRYRVLAWEWLEGLGLPEVLAASSAPQQSLELVGAALANLHSQRPKLKTTYTADGYCERLHRATDAVDAIAPALSSRAQALSQQLSRLILEHHWRSRTIHGDFSADQVLLVQGDAAILDSDRSGYGDPCIDFGSFGAKLLWAAIDDSLPFDRAEAWANALLSGYSKVAGVDEIVGVQLFIAGSLLQLAAEPFRFRRDGWPAKTEALLSHAERMARNESVAARATVGLRAAR